MTCKESIWSYYFLPLTLPTATRLDFLRFEQPLGAVQGVVFGLHSHSFPKRPGRSRFGPTTLCPSLCRLPLGWIPNRLRFEQPLGAVQGVVFGLHSHSFLWSPNDLFKTEGVDLVLLTIFCPSLCRLPLGWIPSVLNSLSGPFKESFSDSTATHFTNDLCRSRFGPTIFCPSLCRLPLGWIPSVLNSLSGPFKESFSDSTATHFPNEWL